LPGESRPVCVCSIAGLQFIRRSVFALHLDPPACRVVRGALLVAIAAADFADRAWSDLCDSRPAGRSNYFDLKTSKCRAKIALCIVHDFHKIRIACQVRGFSSPDPRKQVWKLHCDCVAREVELEATAQEWRRQLLSPVAGEHKNRSRGTSRKI